MQHIQIRLAFNNKTASIQFLNGVLTETLINEKILNIISHKENVK